MSAFSNLLRAQDIVGVVLLCLGGFLFSEATHARPKIGLALGGGGAKGSAHIGVLRVLEEHRIPVDYIAGTSIGSVVGGMYATGMTVDEIQKVMLETSWGNGYSDRIPRNSLPWRIKQQNDQFNIPLELGVRDERLKIPSGILYGQESTKLLREAVGEHPNFKSFDQLVIPFRAVATDLASYKMVVIDGGSLIAAMRASSNVPGVLAPEELGGLLLVDGGITRNLPVDVVRDMGADIIIAVDIGSGLKSKEGLDSTFAVIEQLSAFLTTSNSEAQKQELLRDDILIEPDIDELSTTDWGDLEEALYEGEVAARSHSQELIGLGLNQGAFDDYLSQIQKGRKELLLRAEKPVSKLQLVKKTPVSDELLLEKLGLDLGEEMSAQQINDAVDRLYSMGEFQRVDASTELVGDDKVLRVAVEEKAWGPNFLHFGIGWEDDLDNNSDLNFDLAYTVGNIGDYGGEWRSELKMGSRRSIKTQLYLPMESKRTFYSVSEYSFSSFEWDVYVENTPLMPIDQQYHSLSQGVGYNYTQEGFSEVGFVVDVGEFSDPVLLGGTINYFTRGAYLKFGYDTLDSINFPTQGTYFTFNSFLRSEDVDDHVVISKQEGKNQILSLVLDMNWKGALKFGHHGIVAKASYSEAFTRHGNESIYISYLGGFLNLSGYHKDALAGAKKAFAAGMYQFDLGKSLLHLEQFPLYLGLSFEAGNVWQQNESVDYNDLIFSSSTYVGTDTSLGPMALGYGRTNNNEHAFYFYMGKSF